MKKLLSLFLLPAMYIAPAQDLNGIWQGKLVQAPGGCYQEYNVELQVNFTAAANTLSGRTYDYYDLNRYVKFAFTGRYNSNSRRMVIIERDLMESNIPGDCVPCVKTYDLTWTSNGREEVLTGVCTGKFLDGANACPPYKLTLKRAAGSAFAVDIEQSRELAAIQQKLALQPREKALVDFLPLDTPAVRLDLYDNAEIDNDTVTVFLNNKLLLYRQMLTDKPLTINFNALPGTDYELVMYADNLGSIPPNTALLVVTAGRKKYELRLSSSEQKSASVKFRYDRRP